MKNIINGLPIRITRPIAFIDVESTGTDITRDKILQLGIVTVEPSGAFRGNEWLINPERPIPPDSTAIHGITDDMVKDKLPFRDQADIFQAFLKDCDLGGFNLAKFDVGILAQEFFAAGIKWDLSKTLIFDAGNIYKIKEERSLEAAVHFYCKREPSGSHRALSDASDTMDVFFSQIHKYSLGDMTPEKLSNFSLYDLPRVDAAGLLSRDAAGEYTYNFSKDNKGKRIRDNPGFGEWMLNKDFPLETKHHLRRIFEELFPRPKQNAFFPEEED